MQIFSAGGETTMNNKHDFDAKTLKMVSEFPLKTP